MNRLTTLSSTQIHLYEAADVSARLSQWEAFALRRHPCPLSLHPAWLTILQRGLRHRTFCLEAVAGSSTCGLLPLALVRSFLFGRFLVSLPYVNYGGVMTDDAGVGRNLIDRAIELAELHGVRCLLLRHEQALDHPRLSLRSGHKVHMRLPLPSLAEDLWKQLKPPVRNQVRKGQKSGLSVAWGGDEMLTSFYDVFCQNMRDLGTPVYGLSLFRNIVRTFPDRAEICLVRLEERPVAGALLLHGWGVTEVPSASSLRQFNSTCANMLMYWSLLERAIGRGQEVFDFGRSTPDSSVYRFKAQWGAMPEPAEWQSYDRVGEGLEVRTDNPKYSRMIATWRRLPVALTRLLGPTIVRGIP